MTTRPDWLDTTAYPFAAHTHDLPAGRMHYVDEGEGRPVVFVHGNPAWSFLYRRPIAELRGSHRCIAPDHLGFGLSDKPRDWSYLPEHHAENFARLMDSLDLRDVTLVVGDWGGPIGLSWAIANPERVRSLAITNTWCWPVHRDLHFVGFSGFMGGPIGRALVRRRNFFATSVMKKAFGDATRLTPEIHGQYLAPLAEPREREGTWVFPRQIVRSRPWLAELAAGLPRLAERVDVMLLWGMRDIAFREKELARWEGLFPKSRTLRFPDGGHYLPEEHPEQFCRELKTFLG